MSDDKTTARVAIRATTARGDTALYDALYSSVEAFKGRPGRKAVILLSDGVDDDGYGKQLSGHSVEDVLTLAKSINVPVFTIGLGTEIDAQLLKRIAIETGALNFSAPQASDLQRLYDGIGQQLAGQYNIYYSSNLPGDGSMHRVQLAYNGIVSVKDYMSPASGAKSTPSAAPQASVRTLKLLPGLAAVRMPNLTDGEIGLRRPDDVVSSVKLSANKKEVEVSEGTWTFYVGSCQSKPFELRGGQVLEKESQHGVEVVVGILR